MLPPGMYEEMVTKLDNSRKGREKMQLTALIYHKNSEKKKLTQILHKNTKTSVARSLTG